MANITVSSTLDDVSTHHVRLYSGSTELGLIAVVPAGGEWEEDIAGLGKTPQIQTSLKVSGGPSGTRYSQFEKPFSYVEQTTWEQGRGMLYQAPTPVGFYDSYNAWTLNSGELMPSGQAQYSRGYRDQNFFWPGNVTGWLGSSTTEYIATSFVAQATYSAVTLNFIARMFGTGGTSLKAYIYTDVTGSPGVVVGTGGNVTTLPTDYPSIVCQATINGTLTSGLTYWVVIRTTRTDVNNYYGVAYGSPGSNQLDTPTYEKVATKSSTDGSTWATATTTPFYRVTDVAASGIFRFFEYKDLMYAARTYDNSSTAPKVYRNGYRGVADANTGTPTKLIDAAQAFPTTGEMLGTTAMLRKGTGFMDDPNFRIVSSATATQLTSATAWLAVHSATDTEYVIKGSTKWTEITGHGMTVPITDVVAPGDVMYFSLGDATNIRRWREYNSSGTWTADTWTDDGTNKAFLMATALDNKDGIRIWRGQNSDANSNVSASHATVPAWGTNLQFKEVIPIGHDASRITNIVDGDTLVFVLKEDSIYALEADEPDKVVGFPTFKHQKNGLAAGFQTPNIYFNLGEGGFERLVDRSMDDIGLWRGEGWATNRQGPFVATLMTPQYIFGAVDAGVSGYSSIYANNGGWHEIYRHPIAGERIRDMAYENIPGQLNRLWFSVGTDIMWLPMTDVLNPRNDSTFNYAYEAIVITPWMDEQALDLEKYYHALKAHSDTFAATEYMELDYQTDQASDTSAWTKVAGTFDTAPYKEIEINSTCTRFRNRLRLYSTRGCSGYAPRIIGLTWSVITGLVPKYKCDMTYQLSEEDGVCQDLNGEEDGQTASGILAQLHEWASHPTPVTMQCMDSDLDGITVKVEPSPRRPTSVIPGESSNRVGTITLLQI